MCRTAEETEALRKEMASIDWWHSIDLGKLGVTPGREPHPRSRDPFLRIPEDLTGRTVLDVGAYDGLYSFIAERKGANRVVAIDRPEFDSRGIQFARRVLESSIIPIGVRIEEYFGPPTYDVVFCFGVLYHLKRGPMLALENIFRVMVPRGLLIVETALLPSAGPDATAPMMWFCEGEHDGDSTNWWYPNRACVESMLRATGFSQIKYTGGIPGRGTWHASK